MPKSAAGRPTRLLLPSVLLAATLAAPAGAQAFGGFGVANNPGSKTPGFGVHQADVAVADLFDQFNQFQAKAAWEKAFGVLSQLLEQSPNDLVPDDQGLYLPLRQRVRKLLVGLPPEGREAYRLFHDAGARQALEALDHPDPTGPPGTRDEAAVLERLVNEDFITSVGDRAADRLGDLYFERGDFLLAQRMWQMVLDEYPDSSLDTLRLQTKRGLALAAAGRTQELDEIIAAVRRHDSPRTVTIAGRQVDALDLLTAAAARPAPADVPSIAAAPDPDLTLPGENTPAWQVRYLTPGMRQKFDRQTANWGEQGLLDRMVPATAVDAQRVYFNWTGIFFAVDLRTGKLLWQSQPFDDLGNQGQQVAMWGSSMGFAAEASGDHVFMVGPPLTNLNQGQPTAPLTCLDAATGKTRWSTSGGALSGWGFESRPLLIDGTLFVAAREGNTHDLQLLALDPTHGEKLWSVALGAPQAGMTRWGMPAMVHPMLVHDGNRVYVVTQDGATLGVDLVSRAVAWALTYEPPRALAAAGFRMGWMPMEQDAGGIPGPGECLATVMQSTLYIKEMGGSLLMAINLQPPGVLWRRTADAGNALVGMDDQRYYLAGSGLDALDRHSRAMLWSTPLAGGGGRLQPVFLRNSVLLFTSQGVQQVARDTGDLVQTMRVPDGGSGGPLWRIGNRLVCVSSSATTAFDLAAPAAATRPAP